MEVEEVRSPEGVNSTPADTAAGLRAYYARKRHVTARSALLLIPLAIVAAVWAPLLGLGLAVGGACGVANMLLLQRNNERLLDGRRSVGTHGANNLVRIVGVGGVAAVLGAHDLWAMSAYFAGFFTPLALYAVASSSESTRG